MKREEQRQVSEITFKFNISNITSLENSFQFTYVQRITVQTNIDAKRNIKEIKKKNFHVLYVLKHHQGSVLRDSQNSITTNKNRNTSRSPTRHTQLPLTENLTKRSEIHPIVRNWRTDPIRRNQPPPRFGAVFNPLATTGNHRLSTLDLASLRGRFCEWSKVSRNGETAKQGGGLAASGRGIK